MHNNFIKGADSKLYREKEMLFFKVDIDKYYSSLKRKYFTFIINNVSTLYYAETVIWKGLIFSNATDYIYILPRILCKLCNINNSKWCSFIDCWRIRNLNHCFNLKYRENV